MRSRQAFFILTERNGKLSRRLVPSTVFLGAKCLVVARVLHLEDIEEHWAFQVLEHDEAIVHLRSVLPLKRWQKSKRQRKPTYYNRM